MCINLIEESLMHNNHTVNINLAVVLLLSI